MDSSLIGMTVAIVILVMCSAYFSATETAFTSLNTIRMKTWAENGDKRAARALALEVDAVNVKATTTERLGVVGDGSGISAYAVCLLEDADA